MRALNRFLVLISVFLILTNLNVLSIAPAQVQAASKPSVPQFTVKLVDNSYDVPPTQTTDPYTGKTTTIPGYHVDNKTIDVSIKNQPFTPYTDADGHKCNLYYNVEVKGHFGENWQYFRSSVEQTNSQYTIISGSAGRYVSGDQLDFRVEAVIGHEVRGSLGITQNDWWIVVHESSGWKVQMFTMPDDPTIVSPSQTVIQTENPLTTPDNGQPQTPEFVFNPFFLLGIGALVGGVVVAVVLTFTRHHITPQTLSKQQPIKHHI